MSAFEELRRKFNEDYKKFVTMESIMCFNAGKLFEQFRLQAKENGGLLELKTHLIISDNDERLHRVIGLKNNDEENAVLITTDGTELQMLDISTDTLLKVVLEFCNKD
jgi:hypothetical protein